MHYSEVIERFRNDPSEAPQLTADEFADMEQDAYLGRLVRALKNGSRLCRHMESDQWWVASLEGVQLKSYASPEEALEHSL